MAEKDDYLIDMLVDLGFVSDSQVDAARSEASSADVGVVDYMLANNFVRPADVTQAKAAHFGAEVVQLENLQIPDDVISAVPRHVARKFQVVPVARNEDAVTVAIADPSDLATIDSLTHLLGGQVNLQVASEAEIEDALSHYYGGQGGQVGGEGVVGEAIQQLTQDHVEFAIPETDMENDTGATVEADAPLIRLVNQIIIDAYNMRASDIHLEPMEKRFRLRYRIDGVLHEMKSPPKRLQASMIARLKIQSEMSIAEHRIPQDGRIQTSVGEKTIDLRVSCLPTSHVARPVTQPDELST